ncbi:MAG: hypothetical protein ACLFWR_07355 [Acidimicrobiales bacterium]
MADAHHLLGFGHRHMRLTYPRLIGSLALLFSVVLQRGALEWPSEPLWLGFTGLWLITSVLLIAGRLVQIAGASLAVLSMTLVVGPGGDLHSGLALLWWVGLTLAVTEGHPEERALLIRATVTIVYAFAAIAKMNPSFLAGEQLIGMAVDRPQLSGFEELMRSNVGLVLSWLTIAAEAWLAVGLWIRRTRLATAILGAGLHVVFILAAHNGTHWDIAFVTVLNLTLVASYLAFFHPLELGRSARELLRTSG